jgi:hypothetical protein
MRYLHEPPGHARALKSKKHGISHLVTSVQAVPICEKTMPALCPELHSGTFACGG